MQTNILRCEMLLEAIFFVVSCLVEFNNGTLYSAIQAAKLGSMAQQAAIQAENYLNQQQVAASLADFTAKNDQAQAAANVAIAARTDVSSRKLKIEILKMRLKQAKEALDAEMAQYKQLEDVAEIFSQAAKDAESHVTTVKEVLDNVKNNTMTVEKSESGSAGISFGAAFH